MTESDQSTPTESAEKICLFGGTFDPIHLGHTHIASAAVSQLGIDRVIFLPCQQSPHKSGQQHADGEHRFKMSQLATEKLPWAEVHDFDLISPPPSYSLRTAQAMQASHPEASLYWLMGTDQWESLTHWHRYDELADIVTFIVFSRGTPAKPKTDISMIPIKGDHPASATAIRENIQSSQSTNWLHPSVKKYIATHHLYSKDLGKSSSLSDLRLRRENFPV